MPSVSPTTTTALSPSHANSLSEIVAPLYCQVICVVFVVFVVDDDGCDDVVDDDDYDDVVVAVVVDDDVLCVSSYSSCLCII